MLQKQNSERPKIQSFRATGTVLESDVGQLFADDGATFEDASRLEFVIDPDFDGYLAEFVKGLKKQVAKSDFTNMKIALIMPDRMIPEAALAGLSENDDALKVFPSSQTSVATDWLGC